MRVILIPLVLLAIAIEAPSQIDYPLNPEPDLPPSLIERDKSQRRQEGSADLQLLENLSSLIEACSVAHNGTIPDRWDEIMQWLGSDLWKVRLDWDAVERDYQFIHSVGKIPASADSGQFEGRLI